MVIVGLLSFFIEHLCLQRAVLVHFCGVIIKRFIGVVRQAVL